MRTLSAFLPAQCTRQKEPYLRRKEGGQLLLPIHRTKEDPNSDLQMVTRLVRRNDQEERQSDAAVHWDTRRPKLLRAFADRGAQDFSEKRLLRHILQGSNKTRFEYREDSKISLTCLRAIQGHTGITLALELMGHVIILTIGMSL